MKGNTLSTNYFHPSYIAPAIAEDMPNEFTYVGRPGVGRGISGQEVTPKYSEDSEDD